MQKVELIMINKIILILVLVLSFAFNSQTNDNVKTINANELKKIIEEGKVICLLDVRTKNEYDKGHIKNAKLIDYFSDDFINNCEEYLDKNKPIYVYCKSGGRSKKASKILSDIGFTKIYDLQGGYLSWQKENQ